jgi:hypothetical protein
MSESQTAEQIELLLNQIGDREAENARLRTILIELARELVAVARGAR